MRKAFLAAALTAALGAPSVPANGLAVSFGFSGGIDVQGDFGACATLTAPVGTTFVGSFTAVGEMQGPGTRVGTVRAVIPIVATGSWSACVTGAYYGATAGEAKYVLHAHSATGEYAEIKQCVVNRGAVSCV